MVHAPMTVWLGTQFPDYVEYIKAWKELLMAMALVLLITAAVRKQQLDALLQDRLMQIALAYAGLHFVMVSVFQNGLMQAGAGLLIDLRFILYFVVVYGTIKLYPHWRKLFVRVFAVGAAVVVGFALLQLFVLPKDILANIGYNEQTIAPYLTVDDNHDYVRINSTLRGPNPLGAYAAIVIALLTAYVLRYKLRGRQLALAGVAVLATGLILAASYSRSSVIGAVVAIVVVTAIATTTKMRKILMVLSVVSAVVLAGLFFAFRDNPVVSSVVLHDDPVTGARIDSNEGHWESLTDGTVRLLTQPFGAGVGSTGSASLYGDRQFILENHYLFIAHEVGWIGLGLFVWLFVEVMLRLWRRRQSALALGVFGSGAGLALIGLLLPVWADDTVSIVWWGLAALAIGTTGRQQASKGKKKNGTRKNH